MLLPELRRQVLHANQEIARLGLAVHTFGNVSGIDRSGFDGSGPLVAIKPSGVPYATMTEEDLVLTTLTGERVEGKLNPSSDLDTHLLLYREFPQIGGVVHTHSEFATAWAQACLPIPCLGTTHADYFHGPVPVTAPLTEEEVEAAYVRNTGAVIARHFAQNSLDPLAVPGVLAGRACSVCVGQDSRLLPVEHADLLEYIARLAYRTVTLGAPCGGPGGVRGAAPLPAQAWAEGYVRAEEAVEQSRLGVCLLELARTCPTSVRPPSLSEPDRLG